jgi:hypothetical protein
LTLSNASSADHEDAVEAAAVGVVAGADAAAEANVSGSTDRAAPYLSIFGAARRFAAANADRLRREDASSAQL